MCEKTTIGNQFVNCAVNNVNGEKPENNDTALNEGIELLLKIWRSGNAELMKQAVVMMRGIAAQITDEKSENTEKNVIKPITERLTGSDEPVDQLDCLRSMTEFMRASAIAIGSTDRTLSVTEWDGFINMLGVVSEDLGLIADNV